ncbi:MAG: alpha-2-macroglobulin family protein [Candidatus Zixiibacteriota bacterium]
MTGRYNVSLLIGEDEEVGHGRFSVEEFIPDRMKVTLKTERTDYFPAETAVINVDAVTLFGPPAARRRVQGKIEVEPFAFEAPEYKSFTFSDATKVFEKQTITLADSTLDDEGHIGYKFTVPEGQNPPSMLRGVLSATVLEPGGRGVTAYGGIMIHPYRYYVGLRQAQEGYGKPNAPTRFDFVSTDHLGKPVAGRNIEVTLSRIYWQSILKYDNNRGYHRYVSEQVESQVDKFAVVSTAGSSGFDVVPDDYGRYKVVVRDVVSGATASAMFYSSGWGYSPWAMDNPERIEIDLDKESYQPGEIATVQIRAPFGGKLLLTVEREKVFSHQILTMKDNTATVKVPIGDGLKPNVYVSAHVIRSTDKLERDAPVRAFGVAPVKISAETSRLAVDLQVPNEMRPKSDLTINYKLTGANRGAAHVTIAAVDEGICQLTDMKTPDPHGFFYGKKRLSVETFDVYSVILPEITLKNSPAGDIEAARRRQLTPVALTRVKPVAFWSGLARTNSDGGGSVTFKVPQFNGQLRVMAVAFANDKFGSSEKNVFVREPLVLTPTFPRFVSTNDELTVPVSVYNGTGTDGTFEVTLSAHGPATVVAGSTQSIEVAAGRELPVFFKIKAGETMGAIKFSLAAKGNGASTDMTEDVPLRPAAPFITLAGSGSAAQGQSAVFNFPGEFVSGTTDFSMSVSAFPAVRFVGSLQYLLGYPHGCVEQTVSRLFPMLYFDELARVAEPELFKKNSVDYYIEEGINKLANMQLTSGAFSYWPQGNYQNNWASVYAAHFLIEARRGGYDVPDRVYDRCLSALQTYARSYPTRGPQTPDYEQRGQYDYYRESESSRWETSVYANYVLALANKPDRSTLSYLRNNAREKLPLYSQYQLAGALSLSGDVAGGRTLLPSTLAPADTLRRWESGGSFNSPIRAQAIMLDILAEVEPNSPQAPKLVESLARAANDEGRWYTTQENAFALLALGKVFKQQGSSNYTGTVKIGGVTVGTLSPDNHNFAGKDWAGKNVEISITGTGTAYFFWRADGLPAAQKIDEYDRDIQVRRRYLDENGNAISNDNIRQGDMIVAELTIKALTESVQNVAIADLLPAGFEIENPRLQSRKGIAWIGDKMYQPQYMDIRDDRMVIYGDFQANREEKFYYGIRIVSAGKFVAPPVRAEAMYAPMISSVASSGAIEVKAD